MPKPHDQGENGWISQMRRVLIKLFFFQALHDSYLNRIQFELYKVLNKNGNQRSLRAALIRFADLCSMMRPQKCRLKISWSSINFFGVFFNFYGDILSTLRPYVKNLLPCLIRICRRPEESIQETLASVMPKLCFVFMRFATDAEIKVRRSPNSVLLTFFSCWQFFCCRR